VYPTTHLPFIGEVSLIIYGMKLNETSKALKHLDKIDNIDNLKLNQKNDGYLAKIIRITGNSYVILNEEQDN
jgi:hypothetical protein